MVNKILSYIAIENITPPSRLLKAAGCVAGRKLSFNTKIGEPQKPKWKKR